MFPRSFEATFWREKKGVISLRRDSNRGLLEFRDPDNTNSSQSETFLESDDNVKVLSHRIGAAADTDADADADADAECFVNGQQFKHDELIPSEDKCRSCSCQNGQVRHLLEAVIQGPQSQCWSMPNNARTTWLRYLARFMLLLSFERLQQLIAV